MVLPNSQLKFAKIFIVYLPFYQLWNFKEIICGHSFIHKIQKKISTLKIFGYTVHVHCFSTHLNNNIIVHKHKQNTQSHNNAKLFTLAW